LGAIAVRCGERHNAAIDSRLNLSRGVRKISTISRAGALARNAGAWPMLSGMR